MMIPVNMEEDPFSAACQFQEHIFLHIHQTIHSVSETINDTEKHHLSQTTLAVKLTSSGKKGPMMEYATLAAR